jgi:hypothetical protein
MLQLQTSDVEQISSTTTERLRDIQYQQDSLRKEFQVATIDLEATTHGIEESTQAASNKIACLEATVAEYEKRFTYILPILMVLKCNGPTGIPSAAIPNVSSLMLTSLQEQSQVLSSKVDNITTGFPTLGSLHTPTGFLSNDERLQDLENQVRLLQQRIVGGGVQIGTKTFQSFEDVQVWAVAELFIHRYGLFVDAVFSTSFHSWGILTLRSNCQHSTASKRQVLLPSTSRV